MCMQQSKWQLLLRWWVAEETGPYHSLVLLAKAEFSGLKRERQDLSCVHVLHSAEKKWSRIGGAAPAHASGSFRSRFEIAVRNYVT